MIEAKRPSFTPILEVGVDWLYLPILKCNFNGDYVGHYVF